MLQFKMSKKEEDLKIKTPQKPKAKTRRIKIRVEKRSRKSRDEDIKEISDGINNIKLEETEETKIKIPNEPLKRQKTSLSFNYQSKEDKRKLKRCIRELEHNNRKRSMIAKYIDSKESKNCLIQHEDELDENHIAIIPIIPEHEHIKEYSKDIVSMDDDIVKRYDYLNPLTIQDIIFTSVLTDRDGAIVFYPESKYSKLLNKEKDVMDEKEDGVETENQWKDIKLKTVRKLFKKTFGIVAKKKDKDTKIIGKQYIQYSPHLGVLLVFLEGKEYQLENTNFGDKHYPWKWKHLWDHYNNWTPDYENNVYRRDGNTYLSVLISDVSVADWEVKYRFDEPVQQPDKRLFHKMTWRFIYEELSKC